MITTHDKDMITGADDLELIEVDTTEKSRAGAAAPARTGAASAAAAEVTDQHPEGADQRTN